MVWIEGVVLIGVSVFVEECKLLGKKLTWPTFADEAEEEGSVGNSIFP